MPGSRHLALCKYHCQDLNVPTMTLNKALLKKETKPKNSTAAAADAAPEDQASAADSNDTMGRSSCIGCACAGDAAGTVMDDDDYYPAKELILSASLSDNGGHEHEGPMPFHATTTPVL
jgi:hypothetical protein